MSFRTFLLILMRHQRLESGPRLRTLVVLGLALALQPLE